MALQHRLFAVFTLLSSTHMDLQPVSLSYDAVSKLLLFGLSQWLSSINIKADQCLIVICRRRAADGDSQMARVGFVFCGSHGGWYGFSLIAATVKVVSLWPWPVADIIIAWEPWLLVVLHMS